ncbi:MAG TPA: AAA family ATPase [Pirellulales bacterium]|nr:AAA family ATPase [Pirellulales bacterium]
MTSDLASASGASAQSALVSPQTIAESTALTRRVLVQLDQMLLGREQLHRLVLVGILSRGHILLEGLPGVGKTALIKGLGQILDLKFNRVQFTPDLMPSDILGTHMLRDVPGGGREMSFQPGPIFTNILLADEINRASPKTQSALLEAMQEGSVTLMGQTRPLPRPFFVLASQNPIELEGTYPLPEAQLDRFLFKLAVGDVNVDVLTEIIATRRRGEAPPAEAPSTSADLERLMAIMDKIYLPRPVCRYISRLVVATHPGAAEAIDDVNSYVTYGASPRAAIAMAEAARAHALIDGRPTAGFEDVKAIAAPVMNHRLILNYKARFEQVTPAVIIQRLLNRIDESGMSLPADVRIQGDGRS